MWLPLVFVICSAAPNANCSCVCGAAQTNVIKTARASVAVESDRSNFSVRSADSRFPAEAVARNAEALRTQLYSHWQETEKPNTWNPRCEIVIHVSRASYTAAVGRGSEATFGSSWLENRDCVCRGRRIDLLADKDGELSSLPHELTHVVVSEMLGNRTPPRWFDEGIALLADSVEKQRLHERDLGIAQSRQLSFRVAELLSLDTYPAANRVPAFYGQSRSLTAFLARRGNPSMLMKFADEAIDRGYDRALHDVYGIDDIGALEREWLARPKAPTNYQLVQMQMR